MNTKRSILFWLSVTAIVLLSIYTKNPNIITSISLQSFKITSIKSVFDQSGSIHEFISFINQFLVRLYRLLVPCDESKWKSPLIAKYGVALTLTVDQKGCGKFTSLQKAVDAVPANSPKPTLIIVDAGQYSYSVGVFAPKFIAHDISFKNEAPLPSPGAIGGQAVAFRISGDQAAFYNCGFYGFQDTLFDDAGRHYFQNCFIEGTIDFIFGNGRSLYENCILNSVASGPGINGAIAAHQRASLQDKTGFSFVNCKIQGQGKIWLGRAWGVYSTTVYIRTFMPAIVAPEGWNDWKDPSRDQKVVFGEHACSGPGADFKGRVKFAKQLSVADATPYMNTGYIDGNTWLHP
ncbi:probable pectinesterase 15 isoform X2 [Helianthus annuus]|uniref:probable pectinesterase 15 isoform X2 n=1 Tax=Helianthus annuus TaxID=4232 RepID=UPI001652CE0D|nr:probable pectinesterase 15 isoform X2 [Helianthus annuus]